MCRMACSQVEKQGQLKDDSHDEGSQTPPRKPSGLKSGVSISSLNADLCSSGEPGKYRSSASAGSVLSQHVRGTGSLGSSHTSHKNPGRSVSSVMRRSLSGADLLKGTTEWWTDDLTISIPECLGEVPEKDVMEATTPGGHRKMRATDRVLKFSEEWWRSPASEDEEPQAIEEGWWGSNPAVHQGDGPPTSCCQTSLLAPFRRFASGKRNRYQKHGYDLDLTYVTSRVIAMSFPARGTKALFRNPRSEVAKFLRWRHQDHFRIYNLCIEPDYVYNGFPDQTVHFPCPDHCPLPLTTMLSFCHNAKEWLHTGAENVVIVHCKAGKGRSGTLICAFLVFCAAAENSYQALRWFAHVRGGKRSGVTIPSQIRFLAMFERWLRTNANGLCSNPMAGGQIPHRLRKVVVGPVQASLLSNQKVGKSVIRFAGVRVGMSNRETFSTKARAVHWYDEQIVEASEDNVLGVSFPASSSPVWNELDGVLIVRIRRPGATNWKSRKASTTRVIAWWSHSYLHAWVEDGQRNLMLKLPLCCIDSLARSKQCPEDFNLAAVFEDLRDPGAELEPFFQFVDQHFNESSSSQASATGGASAVEMMAKHWEASGSTNSAKMKDELPNIEEETEEEESEVVVTAVMEAAVAMAAENGTQRKRTSKDFQVAAAAIAMPEGTTQASMPNEERLQRPPEVDHAKEMDV